LTNAVEAKEQCCLLSVDAICAGSLVEGQILAFKPGLNTAAF